MFDRKKGTRESHEPRRARSSASAERHHGTALADPRELQAVSALARLVRRYWSAAFDALTDPVFLCDRSGRVLRANLAYCQRAGQVLSAIVGKLYWETFPRSGGPPVAIEDLSGPTDDELILDSGEHVVLRVHPLLEPEPASCCYLYMLHDVTSLERTREALRQNESRFEQIMNAIPDVVFQLRIPDLVPVFVNPAVEDVLGFKPDELIDDPQRWREQLHEQDRDRIYYELEQVLRDGDGAHFHGRMYHKHGTLRWLDARVTVRRDEQDRPEALYGILTDVTARRHSQQALFDSEERFRSMVELTSDWIWMVDEHAVYTYASPKVRDLLGYKPVEVVGRTPFDFMPPEEARRVRAEFEEIARERRPFDGLENVNVHRDGHRVILETSGVPRFDADGNFRGYRGIDRDTTQRKQAEEALRAERDRAQQYLDVAGVMIVSLDADGCIELINRRGCEILGGEEREILGKSWFDSFLPDSTREEVHEVFRQLMAGDGDIAEYHENPVRTLDGRERMIAWHNVVVRDADGKPTAVLTSGEDISERERAEAQLREHQRRLSTLLGNLPGMAYRCKNDRAWTMELVSEGADALTGYRPEELMGNARVAYGDLIHAEDRDRVWEIVQEALVERRNFQIEYRIVDREGHERWVWEQGAGVFGEGDELAAIEGFITDITDRTRAEREREQTNVRLQQTLVDTIAAVGLAMEKRDPYTAGHQKRVAHLAVAIAGDLGLGEERIEGIRLGSMIHDIGKIYVPSEILSRPGRLSPAEFEIIKSHSQVGYDIVKGVDFPWPVADMILQHHERLDGSGYPRGLRDDAIILEARILAVADVVEAMASHRPYRPGLGVEAALEEVEKGAGVRYDPAVVSACLRAFREGGFDFEQA